MTLKCDGRGPAIEPKKFYRLVNSFPRPVCVPYVSFTRPAPRSHSDPAAVTHTHTAKYNVTRESRIDVSGTKGRVNPYPLATTNWYFRIYIYMKLRDGGATVEDGQLGRR